MPAVLELELMKFSIKLNELLEQSGLTPAQLAKKAQIKPATIRGYLAGTRRNPSGLNILMIAKALNVSADEFMDCLDSLGTDSDEPKKRK